MTKSDSKGQDQSQKMTHKQMEHAYKLSLIRECQIYGKGYKETEPYFKSKGLTLGKTQWKALRKELKSAKQAKDWFSKEALYVIEEDHMLSVERTRKYEDKLVQISNDLIDDDDFHTSIDFTTDKSGTAKLRVKNYNTELFLKLIAEWRALQETKTKMMSATPMVQEMIEINTRREQEENTPTMVFPTSKPNLQSGPVVTESWEPNAKPYTPRKDSTAHQSQTKHGGKEVVSKPSHKQNTGEKK